MSKSTKSSQYKFRAIAALTMGEYIECMKMAAMWERLEKQMKAG